MSALFLECYHLIVTVPYCGWLLPHSLVWFVIHWIKEEQNTYEKQK